MDYEITYQNGKPSKVYFTPDYTCKGTHYDKLGKIAIAKLGVPDWSWKDGRLFQYINSVETNNLTTYIEHSINKAQYYISTLLIGTILEWDNFRQVMEEYRR